MGLFAFYNKQINKFAYSYLSCVKNKKLLYKYAIPEFLYLNSTHNITQFDQIAFDIKVVLIVKNSLDLFLNLIK